MTQTASVPPQALDAITWRVSDPYVMKAIAFLKKRSSSATNAEDLVAWDRDHGRKLFDWNDPHAAEEWRKHRARTFMNHFRAQFENMRVRAIIHIHEDAEADIEKSGYFGIEAIAEHPGMRQQVITDVTRRMRMLAGELKLWKLTPEEQSALFHRLSEVMADVKTSEAA